MKFYSLLAVFLFAGQAQAFWNIECDDKKTVKEYESLEAKASALRIELRDEKLHQMANEVLVHLNLDSEYSINTDDSYIYFGNGATSSGGNNKRIDCEIYAKKSKSEICKIDCQRWANRKIPVQCYKNGTTGKHYFVESDKIENYSY